MKYFGTDGIRGVYPSKINEKLCFNAGRAIGQFLGSTFLVARDSRASGAELAEALIAGINCCAHTKVFDAGIVPTPAASYLVRKNGFDCAAVISASHNPPEYNGIKLFAKGGIKLNQSQEKAIEALIDSVCGDSKNAWKKSCRKIDAKAEYTDFLIQSGKEMRIGLNRAGQNEECFDANSFSAQVFLDCGYGAVGGIARDVFESLGVKVNSFNDTYDGEKINGGCGALYPEFIMQYAREGLGFSFDGDGDRVSCVVDGNILDGDSALYAFSRAVALKDSVVVGTVMANSALEDKLLGENKRLIRVGVGDKNIADLMLKKGYNLGGEQSGHYIFYPDCVSGDGIFAALKLAAAYQAGLVEPLHLIRQKTVSLPLDFVDAEKIEQIADFYRPKLKRLLIRKSGTEPKLRVMAEGDDDITDEAVNAFESLIHR